MQKTETGYVIINIGHPNTGTAFMNVDSFRARKKDAIKYFIEGSGNTWKYWRERYNFRCVKAEMIIKTK